uniref:Cadherin domain-containing protein n=3 Tax=Parascaris TaxID=6254 RepID=A0A915BTY2_PARUN
MTNYRILLLLILLYDRRQHALEHRKASARRLYESDTNFQFTAPLYNVSIEENARGKEVYATSNDPIRIGVPLPSIDAVVKFKIVEGDRQHFKAEARNIGDFVFLRIRYRHDGILNRELKDRYEFLVKATCRRKDAANLETTANVLLIITDQNDARPIFEQEEYRAQISDQLPPFSDVIQVGASDADVGLNGQIYYSIVNKPWDFFIDPLSGWIRTLRTLAPGIYELHLLAEDRESRLFNLRDKDPESEQFQPAVVLNEARAVIEVIESIVALPKISIESKPIRASATNIAQLAAIVRVDDIVNEEVLVDLIDDDLSQAFQLKKESIGNAWRLETVPGYRLWNESTVRIRAEVSEQPERSTTSEIVVEVSEERIVEFADRNATLRISVNESVPVGFVVGKLRASIKNGFEEDRRRLRYSIVTDDNATLPFKIDEKSGRIRVTEWLNHERNKSFIFTVFAELREYGSTAEAQVEISILDSNDHSPVFAAKWARGEPIALSRKFAVGKTIVRVDALDSDIGENGNVHYMLVNDEGTPFVVDSNNGDVKLRREPFMNETSWRLRIRAIDGGWPYPRSSQIILTIYINGTNMPSKILPALSRDPPNENTPKFENLPSMLRVSEDADIGSVIVRLTASDADRGYAGIVRFACWDEFFEIDPHSGELRVAEDLHDLVHHDVVRNIHGDTIVYNVTVTVCDMGEAVKCSNETLAITVIDSNNNAPRFDKPFYSVRVGEDIAIGSEIVVLTASDEDFGDNARIAYKLAGDDAHVEIDSDKGIIRVRNQFDREINEIYRFSVVAYDHGHPPKLTFVNVSIELDDVNDNAPKCAEPIQKVQIPEDYPNGALVTCVAASDADAGENGRITYGFDSLLDKTSAQLPFRVQADTGCIFVDSRSPLDFETRALYNLSIEVMDNGHPTFSTVCTVLVELIDVNENVHAPVFSDIAHEASVYENMPVGTEVIALQAFDPDDPDAAVKYAIVDGDGMGYFTVDPAGIVRTSVVLDREVESRYWLAIEAEDAASVPLSSIVHVFVRVLDKNDNAPLPSRAIYFAGVPENSPEDTVVVKVEAEDRDEVPSGEDRAELRFRIASGDPQSFFSVDPKTGYMTTRGRRRLDRETQREHVVYVEICDQGSPRLCTTVPVVVTVGDLNDNRPVFKQQIYNFNVPAEKIGELCRVFAVDEDEGINAQLFYNVTSDDGRFTIDESGMISVIEPLKGDEIAPLTIQATDMGHPYNTASARIILTAIARKSSEKESNRKPRLLNQHHWSRLPISDADNVGETIGLIEAEDPDGDQLWWTITAGNLNSTFAIRCDAGELLLARPLEYVNLSVTEFHLEFSVSDGIDRENGKIVVEVSRSPQRRPRFTAQHYRTQISEKTPVGTTIYTVKAIVDESGLTHKTASKMIVYGIHSVENLAAADKLRIDPSSGNVVVMESFGKDVAREFSVIVSARNGQMSNYAILSISLLDENDNPPKFLQSEYSVKLLASSPLGTIAATVQAFDPDVTENGVIVYTIIAGNDHGHFQISGASGEIRTVKPLSTSEYSETILTVRASDQSKYRLADTCTVRIQTVVDEEWQPTFQKSVYSLSLRESTPAGSLLMTVYADGASGIRYSLQDSCDSLAVHSVSGAVYLKNRLSREKYGVTINCTVIASNTMGAESNARIVLKLVDVNEHAPFFNQTVYYGHVQENMPPGSAVLNEDDMPLIVKAFDYDSGPNGLVNYRVISPLEPYFTVDFVSGAIRTKSKLDFEVVKEWSIHVLASDMATVALSTTVPALVKISIRDVNDESPKFEKDTYDAVLSLPTVEGVVIASIPAYDADTVGRLRYAIKSKKLKHLFTIDEFEGVVRVNANDSTNFIETEYKVPLVVSDGVHSDSTILIVRIRNTTMDANALHFLQRVYRATVAENRTSLTPEPLLTVTAVDLNLGEAVMYRILNPRPEFVIGAGSGLLSWTGIPLDRELTPQIKLVVQGRTSGSRWESVQCLVVIEVEDVNDCVPRFLGIPYLAAIPHDAEPGEKALSVKAVDGDEGNNGAVRYSLLAGTSHFKINKYDGRITVAQSLENLSSASIVLTVIASDQGKPQLSSNTTVVIELVDRAMPIFTHRLYRSRISESAPVGSAVLTVKAISNMDSRIGYIIVNGDPEKHFRIDFDSGALSVHKSLDRERCAVYNVTIAAVDVARRNVSSECSVVISVDDVNDNPPHFEMPFYEVHVSESASIGSEILQIVAHDPDSTDASVSYGISGANASVLSIDTTTGQIILMKQLDFELQQLYIFSVTASDSDQLTSHATLVLHVEDVNDMAPKFTPPVVRSTIGDDSQPGQFIAKMMVDDMDTVSSLAGGRRFLFSVIDGDETLIDIDKHSGVVMLARAIENEDLELRYKYLNLSVSDGVFTAYAQLIVEVVASPTRRPLPRFEQAQYSASINENGKIGAAVITVRARDGIPSLKYALGGSKDGRAWPLVIDEDTGKVVTRISLDYEKQSIYRIPLLVTDAGGRRAFSTLILNVVDENDNVPTFVAAEYEMSILADAEDGEAIFMVLAVDEDIGDQLEYTIVPDGSEYSSYVKVHPKQGIVSLQKPVRELVGERITLFVRATDLANPPHQSEARVIIVVEPNNVSLPHFSNHHYLFTVPEDAPIGRVIGRVQQNEQQLIPNVRFSIAPSSQSSGLPISVDQSSGKLIISGLLDREKVPEWRFMVRVTAVGDETAGTLAMVTVRVSDVNDNAPQFQGAYERIAIAEDSPVGTSVAVLSATDADSGPNSRIFFSIEKNEGSNAFKMDRESGWLMVAEPLDRETKEEYVIVVVASDEGHLTSRKNLTVLVTDANDSPPIFDRNYYVVEFDMEKIRIGQQLLHMIVTDFDLSPFNNTRLFIVDGDEYDIFSVSNDGRLFMQKLPYLNYGGEYSLIVLAFDGKHHTNANIKVKLRVDSNATLCNKKQLTLNVAEDAKVGTVLIEGNDSKKSKLRRYSLIDGDELETFRVIEDGSVVLAKKLDRETRDKYEFVLKTEGRDLCSQRVVITVDDVNDEWPTFAQLAYSATVKENLNASEENRVFLLKLDAEDRDLGIGGEVHYEFDAGMQDSYLDIFRIDAKTGVLTLIAPLDKETLDRYEFSVRAIDGGGKSTKARVTVDVSDENDNAPQFESSVYRLKVVEDESVGYELIRVKAVGGDEGETIDYRLEAADGVEKYFSLDSKTGSLKLAHPLDYEVIRRLSVSVVGTDSGTPPLSARCAVEIEVLDINDNAPRFSQADYKVSVGENASIGTKVIQMMASDLDSEHFGRVTYSLVGEPSMFTIDDDGWIAVKAKLDREKQSAYRLKVEAADGGSPALKGLADVIIELEDINDNAPVFAQCNMTAVVQESVDPGHVLLTVSLTDADADENGGPFRLEITGDGASSFAFDSQMSLITKTRLSHSKDVYLLMVKAYDRGGLSSECPLTIYVKEESRHPPVVEPLMITLNTLMGEFLGGKIGRVSARDDDASDMLRYSIVDVQNSASPSAAVLYGFGRHSSPLHFSVEPETGEVYAEPDLLAGIHRFNVSVTDGKFTVQAPVIVDVSPIDQDALDHSVNMRLRNISGEQFFADYSHKFYRSFARQLNVKPTNIRILSLQQANTTIGSIYDSASQHRHRFRYRRRQSHAPSDIQPVESNDLDILFTVSRGDSRGYYRPNFIRQRLEQNIVELSDDMGLQIVSLTTEVCRRDVCVKGDCRDRLYLDDGAYTRYNIIDESFYAPRHARSFECICREGFGGKRCDVPIDKCSKEQCTRDEMCVPMDTDIGFECVCPPGTTGDRCATPTCGKDSRECSQNAEISVNGDGFFQMTIANSLERRLELSFNFRTISPDSTMMYAAGNSDFHAIELERGHVQYRWDCGSGTGIVRVNNARVADGKWHSLKVSRRSRHVRVTVDDTHIAEGDSPAGSDVVNLYKNAMRLTFGAQVNYATNGGSSFSASDLRPLISKGMVGCFGRISVDGFDLPKTKQGLRLYNTRMDCDAIGKAPCSANPCGNEGTCLPTGEHSFSCVCSARYTGQMCEVDLTPCVSRPCPPGVQCVNLHNDFYCSCPHGFTGKTCQLRGEWDPCSPNPCGDFGKCIRLPQSPTFICNCSHGYSGTSCSDRPSSLIPDGWPLGMVEVALAVAVLLIVLLAVLVCCYMRSRKYRYDKPPEQKDLEYEVHNFNPRVSKSFEGTSPSLAPPPLPPRGFRSMHNNQLSNFEQAQLTGLPTVQVRPMPLSERLGGSSNGGGSRSPSIAESGRWKTRQAMTSSSQIDVDVTHNGTNSSIDELDQVPQMDVIRRYGRPILENADESESNLPSDACSAENGYHRRANKARLKRGQADGSPSFKEDGLSNEPKKDWRQECDKRIHGACGVAADMRSERMKLHLLGNNRIAVGETILSPREQDDEYMTMRPINRRIPPDSAESQRRPLLEASDSDGMDGVDFVYPDEVDPSKRERPRPPAHNTRHLREASSEAEVSRVYDDPASEPTDTTEPKTLTPELAFSANETSAESDAHEVSPTMTVI